jgi:hypothetical protein
MIWVNKSYAPTIEKECRVAVYGTFSCREQLKRDHGPLERDPDTVTRHSPHTLPT